MISAKEEKILKDMRRRRSKLNYDDIVENLKGCNLNSFERSFIESVSTFSFWSAKQKKVIEKMYAKHLE